MPVEQTDGTDRAAPMERLLYEVKKVIVGQDHLLERLIVALLARGHILVEGVPGLAKTMAIKTLAEAIGGEFKRIQFTPDLVPADLIGTRIYNQKTGEFGTSLGPVFTNLLLADEHLRQRSLRRVDRDRERYSNVDVLAGRVLKQCVDADHLALAVQQRPARVARVDRSVRLDHSPDRPRAST